MRIVAAASQQVDAVGRAAQRTGTSVKARASAGFGSVARSSTQSLAGIASLSNRCCQRLTHPVHESGQVLRIQPPDHDHRVELGLNPDIVPTGADHQTGAR